MNKPMWAVLLLVLLIVVILILCLLKIWCPFEPKPVVFSGQVISSVGGIVSGAQVTINGRTIAAKKDGSFQLVAEPASRYLVTIRGPKEKELEFAFISRIYKSGVQKKTWVLTKATTKTVTLDPANPQTISVQDTTVNQATQNGCVSAQPPGWDANTIQLIGPATPALLQALNVLAQGMPCSPGISITIPPNGLVNPATGQPASGPVTVSVATVDLFAPDAMPGDDSVAVKEGRAFMQPYGAGFVSVSGGGTAYQLSKKGARLTIPVDPTALKYNKSLPKEIPLLVYNEKTATWEVGGLAKLNIKKKAYEATIRHMSAFNMDTYKRFPACIQIDSTFIHDIDSTDGTDHSYNLTVTIPENGANTAFSPYSVPNDPADPAPDKRTVHASYNLPPSVNNSASAVPVGDLLQEPIGFLAEFIRGGTTIRAAFSAYAFGPQTQNLPSGPRWNEPGFSNGSPYGYTDCQGKVFLSEPPTMKPLVSGGLSTDPNVVLAWTFPWPAGALPTWNLSGNDGFVVVRSAKDDATVPVLWDPATNPTQDTNILPPSCTPAMTQLCIESVATSTDDRARSKTSPLIPKPITPGTYYYRTMARIGHFYRTLRTNDPSLAAQVPYYSPLSGSVSAPVPNAVNTAPINTVPGPGPQTVNEDTDLPLSGISVHDNEGNLSTVVLSVTNGTLTVTLQGTVSITAGANSSANLTLSGSEMDINNTLATLVYRSSPNFHGSDTLTVTSTDSNMANDADSVQITVNSVNDGPAGADKTIKIDEDIPHTFTASDFGFTDPDDNPANSLQSVRIATLPTAGTLRLSGAAVPAGQEISAATIGNLVFTPAADANGTPYASFTFQVRDNGGVANGGVNLDASANTITFDVAPVEDAPVINDQSLPAIDEHAANDTVVGTVVASDVENNITGYSITGGDPDDVFDISSSGQVTVKNSAQLDYETSPTFSLTVEVTDGGSQSDSSTITVTLNDKNEAPILDAIGDLSAISGATKTFTATANDVDAGQILTFSLESEPAGAIITTGGAFTWTPAAGGSYTFDVVVKDDGSPQMEDRETITINVDVPPSGTSPTFTNPSSAACLELQQPGSTPVTATLGWTYDWTAYPAHANDKYEVAISFSTDGGAIWGNPPSPLASTNDVSGRTAPASTNFSLPQAGLYRFSVRAYVGNRSEWTAQTSVDIEVRSGGVPTSAAPTFTSQPALTVPSGNPLRGTFTLAWNFPAAQWNKYCPDINDGYRVQERIYNPSTNTWPAWPADTDTLSISTDNTGTGDRATDKSFDLERAEGSYQYRICAWVESHGTCSAWAQSTVITIGAPSKLTILNKGNWSQADTSVVRLRIAKTGAKTALDRNVTGDPPFPGSYPNCFGETGDHTEASDSDPKENEILADQSETVDLATIGATLLQPNETYEVYVGLGWWEVTGANCTVKYNYWSDQANAVDRYRYFYFTIQNHFRGNKTLTVDSTQLTGGDAPINRDSRDDSDPAGATITIRGPIHFQAPFP